MRDVATAPRKHPTITDDLGKLSSPTCVRAGVEPTVIDRYYRSNHGLAGFIERAIEGIAVD